jgi:peptide/nickel transport system substrate-binding protein
MRKTLGAALLALAGIMPAADAIAQAANPRNTLVILREIDADNYDPPRSTARSAGEVIYMMSDTLVALDFDMQTVRPLLAERWEISPDGKTYTFHLRRDVTFCDGRPMTADDVVYSLNRWIDPATRSPVRWRAGPVREIRARDAHTVEYELNEPFGELLFQLTLYFGSVVDRNAVERLGQNFGVQGFNGTGPYCWASWTPRQELVLTRHPNYTWGPAGVYQNPSPQVERVVWRVAPESQTRLAALQTGQGDVTQYIPAIAVAQLQRTPTVRMSQQQNYFWDHFMGFKVDKPVVSDPAVRRAINMAINRDALVRATWFGTATPADSYLNPAVTGFDAEAARMVPRFDLAGAQRVLDEAGWRMGPDGIRVKDGQRASFLVYGIQAQAAQQYLQSMQADLRRVGIEMRIQLWDATVAWGRLATQEFDAFVMSYPYVTATDAFSLYFNSRNRPTPNRMNWNNAETDEALRLAQSSVDPAVRTAAIARAQRIIAENNVWFPVAREQLWVAGSARTEGVRAHGIYGIALYKGLDIRLTR